MAIASTSLLRWPLLLAEVALATGAVDARANDATGVAVKAAALGISVSMPQERRGYPSPYIHYEDLSMVEWAAPTGSQQVIQTRKVSGIAVAPESEQPDSKLALVVKLNHQERGVNQFLERNGAILAEASTLSQIGLRLPPDIIGPVRLDSLAGVAVAYRVQDQSLEIMAPTAMLDAKLFRANIAPEDVATVDWSPGTALNYDVQTNFDSSGAQLVGMLGLRAFAGPVTFETTQLVNAGQQRGTSLPRLDTSIAISLPAKRLTIWLGDTVSAASSWSRQIRIGGLKVGTNFALQPYLVTAPIRTFLGSATLPSHAELYVNGMRRYTGDVPPGPFEIGAGPTRINGAGKAELVLTDVLGRVSTVDFALYETPLLLRRGLSEWSVELGAIRQDYGLRSFGYGSDPVLSGTWRQGLSNRFTLEAHGEASASLANFGVGGALQLGLAGIVSASYSRSIDGKESGSQFSLGYNWSNGRINLAGSIQRGSRNYVDLATKHGAAPARASDFAQIGYSSQVLGNIGAHYMRLQSHDGPDQSYGGVYLSRSMGRNLSLYLSANQNIGKPADRNAFLTINFTPGGGRHVSASIERHQGRNTLSLAIQDSSPLKGGFGWRGAIRRADDQLFGEVQANWTGPAGEVRAGIAGGNGHYSGYAGYSGSLVLMGGQLFAGRRIDDSFAVVTTSGVPEVPVLVENNLAGHTDARGRLLVTGLNAYQRNRVSIDTAGLSSGLKIDSIAADTVPADRAGVVVNFPIRRLRAVLMSLVDQDGIALPLGTPIVIDDREALSVGFDGQLYVEDPQPGAVVTAQMPTGPCRLQLPGSIPEGEPMRTGRVVCEAIQ